jgi:hypothetical protein
MATTNPAYVAIASALDAIKAEIAKNPPEPEKQKLEAARLSLSLALGDIALSDYANAIAAVSEAAARLQEVLDAGGSGTPLAAVKEALAALAAPGGNAGGNANGGGGGFAGRSVATAAAQWDFFGRQTYDINGHLNDGGHKEGEDGWYQRIGRYWQEGVGVNGIDGRNHGWYWSAAFISWVMKDAGAGPKFKYSDQHSQYISQAIRDHLQNNAAAGYWGWRLNEAKPAIGDIVCWGRESGVDYDHQKQGNYAGHSDVIVAVADGAVDIIGGNVGNSVTRRPLATDNGFLKPVTVNGENLFAIMKCRIA